MKPVDKRILLDVKNLEVEFKERQTTVRVLRQVNLKVMQGETVALVGESGCGKSMTARATLNIVPEPGRIVGGSIAYYPADSHEPVEITALESDGNKIRRIRGKEIAMIFQEPMTSFSPVHTVGFQIVEAIKLHLNLDGGAARKMAIETLDVVGIPDPASRVDHYPFQLSGGMRQRAMIAMAIACQPQLLLADEPTTALDVTVQAQIIGLLKRLQTQLGMSVLIITHNLGVVAAMAHRVAVMYLGRIVEEAPVHNLFGTPRHPYTQGLLQSVPGVGLAQKRALVSIPGAVPDMKAVITGCAFHPRCAEAVPGVCDMQEPGYYEVEDGHWVRCVLCEDSGTRAVVSEVDGNADLSAQSYDSDAKGV